MKPLRFFFTAGIMMVFLTAFTIEAKAGLDSYSIYLNDKLILKQAVNQPLNLQSLQLDKANASDKLVIYYSQCNADNKIGKGRSLIIRDNTGNILKEWKFADSKGGETSMVIPVKELLQLEKKVALEQLTLFYSAQGLAQGQKLMTLQVKPQRGKVAAD